MPRGLPILCLLLLSLPTFGQDPVPLGTPAHVEHSFAIVETEPIILGQTMTFRSALLDDEVTLKVWLPDSFAEASDDHTYPVIFASGGHGHRFFETLAGIVKHQASRERIPESIVVSLSNMGPVPTVQTHGMWGRETLGGSPDAPKALEHLEHEVFPYLEKQFRANGHRTIIGVSGSCLFPIYTLTHAPHLFDSHVLIAAADMVGMGYDLESTFIDQIASVNAANPKRRSWLYVATADDDLDGEPAYQRNLDRLEKQLGGAENLDLRVEVIPNTDHYEVFIKAVLSALDQRFPKAQWSARYRDLVAQPGDALANLDRYYSALSKTAGFTVLPRADRWNSVNSLRFLTRHLIGLERTEEAVAIARRRVAYRPRLPAAMAGLVDALEADGQLGAAIEAQQRAIALTKERGGADAAETLATLAERLAALRAQKDAMAEN